MPEYIRSLIVILSIATFVFYYAKKAIGPELLPKEFSRWRNAWFAITLLAFISQNFWVFIILSSLFLLYTAKSEQNKFALYFVLLMAVPSMALRIPFLFDINYVRLLALTILFPFFISFRPSPVSPSFGKPLAEKLLLAYMVLTTLLMIRGTTVTDALRYGFYGFTEIFLPYFVASRAIKDFEQMKKVMIAFVLASLVVGAIGTFEFIRSWLLYNSLIDALHADYSMGGYLGRGDSVRALASLDHSIILGFVMMVGLGFYLVIAPSIKSKTLRLAGLGLIICGLISSLSRGPWAGTVVLFLVLIAFGRNRIRRFALLSIAVLFVLPVLNWIPGGQKVINLIPYIGETDKFNVEYRENLIDKSILIIKKYPLFGVFDPRKEPEMEDMVQGQGIVDIVNTYLGIVLYSGLVGLSLFLGFYFLVIKTIFKGLKRITDKKSEEYFCGRILLATLVAMLVAIFTVSSIGIIPTVYWSIAGLIYSFVRITNPARITRTNKFIAEKPVYPTSRLKTDA